MRQTNITIVPLAAMLLFLLTSCNIISSSDEDKTPIPADMFEVHLTIHYENTPVQIQINGEEVFDSTATTNRILALAEIIEEDIMQGTHTISTTIGDLHRDTIFSIKDTLVIQIRYNFLDSEDIEYLYFEPPNLPLYY